MNKKLKSALKISLSLLLAGLLVWYSLSKTSTSQLLEYFKNANYFWVGLGVFFGLLSHLSRAYRWRFQLEPMGYNIKLGNSIMAVFATYIINYTIPRAGEVARASVLTNYEGVPFEKSFGTIVSERLADMLVMLVIISMALILQFDVIFIQFSEKIKELHVSTNQILTLAIASLIVIVLLTRMIKRGKSKAVIKIKSVLSGLLEGITSILKMKKKWAFIFHTLFIWGMYVLMFYVTSFSLEETSQLPFSAILIGFIFASFSIAVTNGGIGSYPEAIVIAFTLFNFQEDPSRAFGWIMWTSQTLMVIVLGGFSLFFLPIYNKLYSKQTSE
ncbi:MAG: lysylphosphatidylglycerol synthase transmembrane domain-containing protein [Flavobacteriaceae bacterium]|nr:lysylphosphatidylglycerol synthase transmembrane domain-containing protein [Flavobacteriaceae bacterium]